MPWQRRGDLPEGCTPDHLGQIIQAACLAHDIGNPPFGHAGEEAIRDWFKDSVNKEQYFKNLLPAEWADFTAFDGNARVSASSTRLKTTRTGAAFA